MSDEPQLLMAGQMFEFDSRNHKGRHRHLKSGSIWLAEQEIERTTWDLLETIPPNAIIHHVIWWSDGDPTGREKAEPSPLDDVPEAYPDDDGPAEPLPLPAEKWKPEKGPFGKYWAAMYAKGFDTFPELWKALGVSGMGDSVKKGLRNKFGVDSLTNVRPDRFERFCIDKNLPRDLIAKSQRAREALAEKENAA